VTGKPNRLAFDDTRAKAASIARSGQVHLGRGALRRKTAFSCRNTRISTSLSTSDTVSNAIHDVSRQSIRYSRRNTTRHDHAVAAPSTFRQVSRLALHFRHPQENPAVEHYHDVREAGRDCPGQAITVTER